MKILIPTAGNRSLLISAFREQKQVEEVITTEIDELAPGNYSAHRSYHVPRSTDPRFLEVLENICQDENIKLLVPLADLDLVRFTQERERFAKLGVKVLAVPERTLNLSMDKLQTFYLFRQLGIPTPHTMTLAEAQQGLNLVKYPVYLKPRYAGMKNSPRYFFKLLDDVEDLEYYCRKLKGQEEDYLLQDPLMQGREINVDFFVQDGELKRLVPLYRLKAGDGGGIIRGKTIPCDRRIREYVEKLVSELEFYGATNIQLFAFEDGSLLVTEINPRFSNSSALVVRPAGVDFFDLTLKMLQNETISPEFDNYRMIAVTSCYQPILVDKSCFV
ncbi:ATP-grasp domain-containing protein [Tumidithrix helvetica PCC 7403]|uniref:ATP-grasp domain-containing protein n=1 Tax=Tumidithrix helvetica TaxID=3457545 RepID=UPI003CC30027